MSITPDPRVTRAIRFVEDAERILEGAKDLLKKAHGTVLSETGIDPTSTIIPRTWDCKESPVGKCAYDWIEDPCMDSCIFCHNPEERK